MEVQSAYLPHSASTHLKFFLALSRTPHGLLDMATPALTALLWYGAIPSLRIISLGFITAFAGYTAVYALNDLVDYRVDKKDSKRGYSLRPMTTSIPFLSAILWPMDF